MSQSTIWVEPGQFGLMWEGREYSFAGLPWSSVPENGAVEIAVLQVAPDQYFLLERAKAN